MLIDPPEKDWQTAERLAVLLLASFAIQLLLTALFVGASHPGELPGREKTWLEKQRLRPGHAAGPDIPVPKSP